VIWAVFHAADFGGDLDHDARRHPAQVSRSSTAEFAVSPDAPSRARVDRRQRPYNLPIASGALRVETIRLGVIMNGVTGRMGTNQHLVRSINAIRAQGGVALSDGRRVVPDPILVGRNEAKIAALARAHGIERYTTDLDAALADKDDAIYFDSASTGLRPD
jgi:hypothetical protein